MNGALPRLAALCGPTASGKTAAALALASRFPLEVVSADSRQVYRLMDIGTAKPTAAERGCIPHHLIDVAWPDEPFDAARFVDMATASIDGIRSRGRLPLLVGGTGLYIRALTEGLVAAPAADPGVRRHFEALAHQEGVAVLHRRLGEIDPESAARLAVRDRVRIIRALEVFELTGRPLSAWQRDHGFRARRYRLLKIALAPPRDELYRRIDARAAAMFAGGLVEETQALLAAGYDPQLKTLQTIGYREAIECLAGRLAREESLVRLQQATRRYAKRQLTWFRGDAEMIWVDPATDSDRIQALIAEFYDA
ncbi:MAG: tRNA (adenosine(37)-N6)-dimethylallyltransferase MiaA [Deltaproteobacteria bacterium]|nr:MAG: tRNA (adenosine(37)-N6)-dimethylallyltransferase MiaA [Deltaproteobacteria bacterium]